MAKTEEAPEQQVEAASPETVAEPSTGRPHEITTTVWVPSGPVERVQLEQAAIRSVRDAIPVVYNLTTEIVSTRSSTRDKVQGREYTYIIRYTPRGDGKEAPVNVDSVIKGLEVPTFEGFHPGDPDFGNEEPQPGK